MIRIITKTPLIIVLALQERGSTLPVLCGLETGKWEAFITQKAAFRASERWR